MCIASKYDHTPLCYGGVAAKTSPRAAPKFALIDRPRLEVLGSSRRASLKTNKHQILCPMLKYWFDVMWLYVFNLR